MNSLATRGNYLLASVLAGDALMSIKPPKFISRCLNGVNFPRDWWWALIGIKSLAATATKNTSMTTTVSVGVLGYFIFAIIAHIRANFLGREFWVNCLGMTALSATVVSLNLTKR